MNEHVAAAVLGVVQGVTEFLPVSSSGHLVLFQQWLPPVGDHVAFDLVLHLGTLVPVLFVYRDELLGIPRDILGGEGPLLQRTGVRLLMLMTIGSIPTAAIGLVFQDVFEQLFANPVSVGVAFAVTGFVLFATRYIRQGDATEDSTRWWQAVMVGIAQGIAITPGVSRSGSTIAAGLLLGFKREFAARYSFLLSIPAISGAFLLK
ncbi:MAG: undecaprenyl-diphosphate phosphatase, partial [Myxococcota bacterium]|nr:undecaprenyl-diphosphate phosphatase [Myxococcota bacterium]